MAQIVQFVFTNTARVEGEKAAWNRPGPYRDNGMRRILAPPVDGKITLRALVDRASLELFAGDGQAAASFVVVPDPTNRRIAIEGDDEMKARSLVVHELKSAWPIELASEPLAARPRAARPFARHGSQNEQPARAPAKNAPSPNQPPSREIEITGKHL